MEINRPGLKLNARKLMRETQPNPVIVGLVFYLIVLVLGFLSNKTSGNSPVQMFYNITDGNWSYQYVIPTITWYGGLVGLAITIMNYMMSVGFTIYSYNVVKKDDPDFGNLFDGFAIFGKVIWLGILQFIFTFLWSLLLIVPGIVAAYRYRQSLYIMLDNPEMSALECITASKQMMDGHKGELFVMDLSFLGWYILCIVPFVGIWVEPYASISFATYYVALRDIDKPHGGAQYTPDAPAV